jgi:hypothetical protein
LAGLRTLLFELRPATLEQIPLATLLRQLGEAMSTRADVPIAVRLQDSEGASRDVEPLMPAAVKVVFYRVAQEALMNAAKYANAHTIRVRLRIRGTLATNRLELEVADDGRGFDPEAVPTGHFGLAIMRERAGAQSRWPGNRGEHDVAAWQERDAGAAGGSEASEAPLGWCSWIIIRWCAGVSGSRCGPSVTSAILTQPASRCLISTTMR